MFEEYRPKLMKGQVNNFALTIATLKPDTEGHLYMQIHKHLPTH